MSNPEISFKYQTILQVDKSMLQTAYFNADPEKRPVDPDELEEILKLGATAIRSHVEAVYEKTVERHPLAGTPAARDAVVRPSIWVAQMTGPHHASRTVYSRRGQDNTTEIMTNPLELKPALRPYWHVIERAGFVPESRQHTVEQHAGAWILARVDPTKLPEQYDLDA
ncbi:MAG: hypothetical protein JWO07_476 [Candidatus Saccharibacteria bacterium]|nr:hypothetical protein [Candidatus Saccharibacteria bacterium]